MAMAIAAGLGIDTDNEGALQTFLNTPLSEAKIEDIIKMQVLFHTRVTQPELHEHALKVEGALQVMGDQIIQVKQEMKWLGNEARSMQKQRCSVQCVLSGWPKHATVASRHFFILEMIKFVQPFHAFLNQW